MCSINHSHLPPFESCVICGSINYPPGFIPYAIINREDEKDAHGKIERKKQPYRPRTTGTCSKCGKKNMEIYSVKNKLCQVCYRKDLGKRKEVGNYRKHRRAN